MLLGGRVLRTAGNRAHESRVQIAIASDYNENLINSATSLTRRIGAVRYVLR